VMKFDGADALVAQLEQDAQAARAHLGERNGSSPR